MYLLKQVIGVVEGQRLVLAIMCIVHSRQLNSHSKSLAGAAKHIAICTVNSNYLIVVRDRTAGRIRTVTPARCSSTAAGR